jgi:hypothetical protein
LALLWHCLPWAAQFRTAGSFAALLAGRPGTVYTVHCLQYCLIFSKIKSMIYTVLPYIVVSVLDNLVQLISKNVLQQQLEGVF